MEKTKKVVMFVLRMMHIALSGVMVPVMLLLIGIGICVTCLTASVYQTMYELLCKGAKGLVNEALDKV